MPNTDLSSSISAYYEARKPYNELLQKTLRERAANPPKAEEEEETRNFGAVRAGVKEDKEGESRTTTLDAETRGLVEMLKAATVEEGGGGEKGKGKGRGKGQGREGKVKG